MDDEGFHEIKIHFDNDKDVTFNARDWWVHQTNGVQILTIQDKESSETSYDIPLASVLYWCVEHRDSDSDEADTSVDRFCDTCKRYFQSERYAEHPYPEHDVKRLCCGTSPQHDHHPACDKHDRFPTGPIGTIVDIADDGDGLKVVAKLNEGIQIPEHLKRFVSDPVGPKLDTRDFIDIRHPWPGAADE